MTLAGVLPDADGLVVAADVVRSLVSGKENTFQYYQQYHHMLLHGWPGALAITALLVCFARKRLRTAMLCLFVFHLHLFCDFIGSRGSSPNDLWPIAYGEPLFRNPYWFWKGQWKLDGWQNRTVFVVLFALSLWLAARRGYSFVELASRRLDSLFVGVLQKWRNRFCGKQNPVASAD